MLHPTFGVGLWDYPFASPRLIEAEETLCLIPMKGEPGSDEFHPAVHPEPSLPSLESRCAALLNRAVQLVSSRWQSGERGPYSLRLMLLRLPADRALIGLGPVRWQLLASGHRR